MSIISVSPLRKEEAQEVPNFQVYEYPLKQEDSVQCKKVST